MVNTEIIGENKRLENRNNWSTVSSLTSSEFPAPKSITRRGCTELRKCTKRVEYMDRPDSGKGVDCQEEAYYKEGGDCKEGVDCNEGVNCEEGADRKEEADCEGADHKKREDRTGIIDHPEELQNTSNEKISSLLPPSIQGNVRPSIPQLLLTELDSLAIYKLHSHQIHFNAHVPALRIHYLALNSASSSPRLDTVFLCSSILAPQKTTCTNPPMNLESILLSPAPFSAPRYPSTPRSLLNDARNFDAGVRNEKVQHTLYRLQQGLLDLLMQLPTPIKVWVVQVGAQDLRVGRMLPFSQEVLRAYELLLRLLLLIEDSQVLAVAMFQRPDVQETALKGANAYLKEVVEKVNEKVGGERILWIEQPSCLKKRHFDGADLDKNGYPIWDEALREKVNEILEGQVLKEKLKKISSGE
ncbi:hypothetical protein M501DRAFT_661843 [Patellaria atrata CBS 101060]|uniref:SGNH hydrolase-type esterase domain-containing protein n=1 Tax=Patellaria atrata CBS 101060 TaxID=1346257 RepID=A0A9P4VTL4_9PEZI|nr:hypothetical protein M501DRAFT_661843 [Patellaria atrata CBS 101060]